MLLFALWTYGSVEMQFQHMHSAPFDAIEGRLKMIRRLNAIRGVSIPEGAAGRRPAFDLLALAGEEERSAFLAVMEWAVSELRFVVSG